MTNSSYKYNPNQNYCDDAKKFQSVLNTDETKQKLIAKNQGYELKDIQDDRLKTLYACPDNYKMASVKDDRIYISTTDNQHDQIVSGKKLDPNSELSGYFSDQATIDTCKNADILDNTKYNEATQIAPYRKDGIDGIGDATYKPHIDCFEMDRDRLQEIYGTRDFNAAIAKCEANNQFGSGGGNQGYNPYIAEMIENKSLSYNEAYSFSDPSISKSEHNNPNSLTNSIVPEDKADQIYDNAQIRSSNCIANNTPHPSSEACDNGFSKENAININSDTGNAVPINRDIDLQADLGLTGATTDTVVSGQTMSGVGIA